MDSLDSSSDFQFFHSFFQTFEDRSKCIIYKWYYFHLHVLRTLQFSYKLQAFFYLFVFFYFHSETNWNSKIHFMTRSELSDLSQNYQKFYASHFLGQILVCVSTICQHGRILICCTIPSGLPSHPVVPSLVLLYSRVCYIRLLYESPFNLVYNVTYSCSSTCYQFWFDIIGSYGIILYCFQKTFILKPRR